MKAIPLLLVPVVFLCGMTTYAQQNDKNFDGIDDFAGQALYPATFPVMKDTGDILHTIPSPSYMCWALTWDGTHLWTANYVNKKFQRIDPETGEIILSFSYPSSVRYIEGMAWDGEYLWAVGWYESNGTGSRIFKIDPTDGSVLKNFIYPSETPWPHGITYDGNYLWAANFLVDQPGRIEKINPENGNLLLSMEGPSHDCIGMAWDGNSLWTNDWTTHLLIELAPDNETIELTAPSPCWNPRDMAWDGECLWVISWENIEIYRINVGPAGITTHTPVTPAAVIPNPVSVNSTIVWTDISTPHISLRLLDLCGKTVAMKKDIPVLPGESGLPIAELCNPADFEGLYIIEIRTAQGKEHIIKALFP
ncbi:MAG TPA: hypothetical protein PLS41_05735 [Bacteroidales bacterium]|nr:hypothetical protein [Bacteroidales bacterium]